MTDQRAKTGGESEAGEERILTGTLTTPPLNEDALASMRVAVAQEWLAVTSASTPRHVLTRRGWRVGMAAAAALAALMVGFFSMRSTGEPFVIGSPARLNDGGIHV